MLTPLNGRVISITIHSVQCGSKILTQCHSFFPYIRSFLLQDIASGLRYLHSSTPAILHLDVKPSNLLIDDNFRAKVADFGLSNSKDRVGSPFWMAPEVVRGETPTAAADVYGFAVVMYEIFAGKQPYEGRLDFRRILYM